VETLESFKLYLSNLSALGRIPVQYQRIFHFGRELKTPRRLLKSSLGVHHGPIVVHLHCTISSSELLKLQKPQYSSESSSDDAAQPAVPKSRAGMVPTLEQSSSHGEIVDLMDDSEEEEDDDDDSDVEEVTVAVKRQREDEIIIVDLE
jgi:hypothetical protein